VVWLGASCSASPVEAVAAISPIARLSIGGKYSPCAVCLCLGGALAGSREAPLTWPLGTYSCAGALCCRSSCEENLPDSASRPLALPIECVLPAFECDLSLSPVVLPSWVPLGRELKLWFLRPLRALKGSDMWSGSPSSGPVPFVTAKIPFKVLS
jgi:hypothetical protein